MTIEVICIMSPNGKTVHYGFTDRQQSYCGRDMQAVPVTGPVTCKACLARERNSRSAGAGYLTPRDYAAVLERRKVRRQ